MLLFVSWGLALNLREQCKLYNLHSLQNLTEQSRAALCLCTLSWQFSETEIVLRKLPSRSTQAIWRGAVHTDAIICVSPPVQDSFALFYQRGKNFSWLYKDIDSGYTVSVNQDWFSMPRFAHQALSCFVSRNKCFLCPDVLFKTMDHQCTWPPYCTHCLCASLFLCISACPCVFVSLYLTVIVFVFLFLCVSEQHLVPIPSIVILGFHSSSLYFSVWSKNHCWSFFQNETFQWKKKHYPLWRMWTKWASLTKSGDVLLWSAKCLESDAGFASP